MSRRPSVPSSSVPRAQSVGVHGAHVHEPLERVLLLLRLGDALHQRHHLLQVLVAQPFEAQRTGPAHADHQVAAIIEYFEAAGPVLQIERAGGDGYRPIQGHG